MDVQLTDDNLHFSRFISHLQYFAARFFNKIMLVSTDDFLSTRLPSVIQMR